MTPYISNGDINPSPNTLEIPAHHSVIGRAYRAQHYLPLLSVLFGRTSLLLDFHFLVCLLSILADALDLLLLSLFPIYLHLLRSVAIVAPSYCIISRPSTLGYRSSLASAFGPPPPTHSAFRSETGALSEIRYYPSMSSVRYRPFLLIRERSSTLSFLSLSLSLSISLS